MTPTHPPDVPRRSPGEWILFAILFLQGIRAFLYPWTARPDDLGPDGQTYIAWAAELAGDAFPFRSLPSISSTTLYCFVLAGIFGFTGPSVLATRIFNLGTWVGLLVATHVMARRVFGPRIALLATVTLSLDDPFNFIKYGQYELLLALLTLLATLAYLRGRESGRLRWSALSGLLWGLAVLTQGKVLPLAGLVVLAGWARFRHRDEPPGNRLAGALLVALSMAIVLLPWAYRNRVLTGDWMLTSSNGGVTFYIGNNPRATGTLAYPPDEWFDAPAGLSDKERDRYYYRKGWTFITSEPVHAVCVLVPRKLMYLFEVWKIPNLLLLVLAVAGIRRSLRSAAGPAIPTFLATIAYVVLIHVVYYGWGRHRFPCLPYLHMFAAVALVALARRPGREAPAPS